MGSYGSGPIMSVEQRKTVISVVTERVEGRIPIVVHAGDPDTLTTIDLAKFAAQKNVSAIASLTPYYYSAWPRGGRHPLPAPNRCGGYLKAAADRGVAPADCVVVEDSMIGARAARAAGMRCLGYARTSNASGQALLVEQTFDSMDRLPELLGV